MLQSVALWCLFRSCGEIIFLKSSCSSEKNGDVLYTENHFEQGGNWVYFANESSWFSYDLPLRPIPNITQVVVMPCGGITNSSSSADFPSIMLLLLKFFPTSLINVLKQLGSWSWTCWDIFPSILVCGCSFWNIFCLCFGYMNKKLRTQIVDHCLIH